MLDKVLHNKLCELTDLLTYIENPCNWENGKCKFGKGCCYLYQRFDGDGTCDFLGKEGCTIPNIHCKLYFCDEVELSPRFRSAIDTLKKISKDYGVE